MMVKQPFDSQVDTELWTNPVINKHQIQPEYQDEQADMGRDC